jgi:hypothetical protein
VEEPCGPRPAEVAGSSESQREAADISNGNIETLTVDMGTVTEASASQVEEANTATDRVEVMGETGAKVVATAQQQGDPGHGGYPGGQRAWKRRCRN